MWMVAALSLALGLARRLAVQNVVAVTLLAATLGTGIDLLNAHTSLPFGQRTLMDRAGPQTLGVAWFQPFLWVTLAIAGRGVARLILRPWRKLRYYGLWVIATATALALSMAIVLEPFAASSRWWWRLSRPGGWTWYGMPVTSALGWILTLLIIYGFTTPWFLNKQPVKQPTDWHPLLVWAVLALWLSVGNAQAGSWGAVLVGGVVGGVAAVLAVRGGRW